MIISHKHCFIFTAVPKTGTHSVRQALRKHLSAEDVEQVRLFVEKQLPYPELAKIRHGHISLLQLRPVVGDAVFRDYFKFAFVRNPFDRFVSYCAFATSRGGSFQKDPRGVMRHFLFTAPPYHHMVFQPQHVFLTDEGGELLTDKLGRVEEMQSSYDAICSRIGVASQPLERANSSTRDNYHQYYTPDLIDGVRRIYARDLELFGYDF